MEKKKKKIERDGQKERTDIEGKGRMKKIPMEIINIIKGSVKV